MDTTVDKTSIAVNLICAHSMFVETCLGCWRGHASRLEKQLNKLEASTALPIRERVEKAVRQQMEHCYQVYKGVPPTVEDWVGGALHYVMWGIERDLPLLDASNTRQRAERAAQAVINEFQGCMLVPDGYTHQMFYLRRLADIVTAEFDK